MSTAEKIGLYRVLEESFRAQQGIINKDFDYVLLHRELVKWYTPVMLSAYLLDNDTSLSAEFAARELKERLEGVQVGRNLDQVYCHVLRQNGFCIDFGSLDRLNP